MKARLILAFALLFLPLRADETAPLPSVSAPVTDPARVQALYQQIAARPEYQETAETDVASRLKDYLSQWFMRIGNKFGQFQYAAEMPAFASLLMTILMIFAIAGLLYVVVRLTRRGKGFEEESVLPETGAKTFRPPEFYDTVIREAISAGDWHTAWMASWRQFLSRLENRNLVEADRTRTNREYLSQLRAKLLPSPALDLVTGMVDDYDRTIYGRRAVAESDWSRFNGQIAEAGLLLNLGTGAVSGKGDPA